MSYIEGSPLVPPSLGLGEKINCYLPTESFEHATELARKVLSSPIYGEACSYLLRLKEKEAAVLHSHRWQMLFEDVKDTLSWSATDLNRTQLDLDTQDLTSQVQAGEINERIRVRASEDPEFAKAFGEVAAEFARVHAVAANKEARLSSDPKFGVDHANLIGLSVHLVRYNLRELRKPS